MGELAALHLMEHFVLPSPFLPTHQHQRGIRAELGSWLPAGWERGGTYDLYLLSPSQGRQEGEELNMHTHSG